MDNQNLKLLADMSFSGKNFADSYEKYALMIENDINNIDAWVGKGLSAGFLSNAEKSRLDETITILKHIANLNISEEHKSKISENLILISRDYIEKLVKSAKERLAIEKNKPMATGELYAVRAIGDTADRFKVNNSICDEAISAINFAKNAFDYSSAVEIKKEFIHLIDKFLSEVNNEIRKDYLESILSIRTNISDKIKNEDPSFVSSPPQKSDGCYIATHIYGSYDNENVIILRRFRDEQLRPSYLGRGLISLYYYISPKLVSLLYNSNKVNAFIKRIFLNPLVKTLR
jgi:hypothetical protein